MIEYIGDEEAQTRGARVAMDEKITGLVAQRVMFDLSPAGKRLTNQSLMRSFISLRMKWLSMRRKMMRKMLTRKTMMQLVWQLRRL